MTPQEIKLINHAVDMGSNKLLKNPYPITDMGRMVDLSVFSPAADETGNLPPLKGILEGGGLGMICLAVEAIASNLKTISSSRRTNQEWDAIFKESSSVDLVKIPLYQRLRAAISDSNEFFNNPFPNGASWSGSLVEGDKLTRPFRRIILPEYANRNVFKSLNMTLSSLGRPEVEDAMASLVDKLAILKENINVSVLVYSAASNFPSTGVYSDGEKSRTYGEHTSKYCFVNTSYFSPSETQRLENAKRSMELIRPFLQPEWTEIANMQNILAELSMCANLAGHSQQLLSDSPDYLEKVVGDDMVALVKKAASGSLP